MKYISVVATLIAVSVSCENTPSNYAEEYFETADFNVPEHPVTGGEELFKIYCNACHGTEVSDPNSRLAPPAFMVKQHYTNRFDDKEAFIDRVATWIVQPSADKALMPGAIRRFNLMPPLALPEKDRKAIAKYFYDNEFAEPDWFKDHHQGNGQHNGRGQGQGQGQGQGKGRN